MFTHTDWLVHLAHHKDLLREAENERLVKIALAALSAHKAEKKAKTQQDEQAKIEVIPCCETVTE